MPSKNRTIFIALAVLVSIGLTACHNNNKNSKSSDNRMAKSQPTSKPTATSKRITLHVHGLESKKAADEVRSLLSNLSGLSEIKIDAGTGQVSFDLLDSKETPLDKVIEAFEASGYTAHEG